MLLVLLGFIVVFVIALVIGVLSLLFWCACTFYFGFGGFELFVGVCVVALLIVLLSFVSFSSCVLVLL